jgi:hypothetical protein
MRRVRWVALGLGAALSSASGLARAEAGKATHSLSWVRAEGAEECPTARALATEVERRLGRPVFDPAAARSFEVLVTRVAGQYRSDVFVRDESGRAIGQRTLQSDEPGCQALFGATALAIALVIDPEAAGRQPAATVAFDAPPPPPPASPPAPAPAPQPAPVVVVLAPRPAPPAPPARAPTPVTVSLLGEVSARLVPEVSPGVGLSFGARPHPRWGFAASAWYTAPQTARQGLGDLEIGLTRATLAATLELARSQRVRLGFAAGPSLGAFHLAVREPAPVTDPGDFWFAAVELGLGLQIFVSKDVFLDLGGSSLSPLIRQEFSVRGQNEPIWQQSTFGSTITGHAGLGLSFP